MKVEILNSRTREILITYDDLSIYTSISQLKDMYRSKKPHVYNSRQAFRKNPRGRILADDETLQSLEFTTMSAQLYFKDLGAQIGWKTVFLAEYSLPFCIYLVFYMRPSFIYGASAAQQPMHKYANIACVCFLFHYTKRLLETCFVHRFSNATMPIANLFKNCTYYGGFSAFIAYYVNHPLYTPALYGDKQVYASLIGFIFCQLGNYSCHALFKNLRAAGTRERKIPFPNSNPMTQLFNFVSCPNYTYEIGSWICFTILTQTLSAGAFTVLGAAQMAAWAIKKHRNYKKEFKDYPRGRKAIFPFVL